MERLAAWEKSGRDIVKNDVVDVVDQDDVRRGLDDVKISAGFGHPV